jgi:phosphate transport system protein
MGVYWQNHLSELRNLILLMGGLVEHNLEHAIQAFQRRDDSLADLVEDEDQEIDQYEIRIDDFVVSFISTHSPRGQDCRFLLIASKLGTALEEIADQATTIARRARHLNKMPLFTQSAAISSMLPEVQSMVRKAIEAFVQQDVALALEVIRHDNFVDSKHKEAKRELEAAISAEPALAGAGIHLFTISKALERAADRAASIAEEVVFLVNAQDIRHSEV